MATPEEHPLPRFVRKPWGHEIWYALTDHYAGKLLHVEGGQRLSLQFHERKDESCYLLSGQLLLIQGPSVDGLVTRTINPGDVWRNAPGVSIPSRRSKIAMSWRSQHPISTTSFVSATTTAVKAPATREPFLPSR